MKYIIIFVFFCQIIQAQDFTLFSTEISFPNNNLVCRATLPIENGILAVGIYNTVGYKAIFLAKTSYSGEMLWIKILDDDSTVGNIVTGAAFIPTDDGHFAIIYSKYKTIAKEDKDVVLMKFMGDGTVLWTQSYGEAGDEAPLHLMKTSDGGYLITGFQEVLNDDVYYYVIKTQEGGFKLWDKRYKWNGYSYGAWAAESPNGGYLISGFAATSPAYEDTDVYIIRIDEEGEKIWGKNYGSIEFDGAAIIQVNRKNNFIFSSSIRENGVKKNYHVEIDDSGSIVWEKIYDIDGLHPIQTEFIIREDNSFMGVAFIENEHNHYQPLLMNFSSRGDTLWTKRITFDPHSDIYIRDIEPIEGGYVLAGFKHFPLPQHGWLVTIDEEGNFCEELGCVETVVDIEDVVIGGREVFVQISPNPVRGQATIEYQIPKDGVLKVYDYQGREVGDWRLDSNDKTLTLEVEDWVSGVYLYSVEIGEERVEGGKLIVE
ncbi:MAG: T9SS type A sorting domain-containing protein [Chitinophagales bacterium]